MAFEVQFFQSEDIECIINEEGYLGAGSNSRVKLGFYKHLGIVAVKCLVLRGGMKTKKHAERIIKDEIEMVQQAHHDNIVRVYGWTQWPGAIAIVMEYLPGGNLMEALDDPDVPLEPLLRLRMVYEISNAIAFIHNLSSERRLVHGDIKTENILLTEDLHCKLSDFGGATLSAYTGGSTSTNRSSHSNQFTEFYASPEILENPTAKMKPPQDTYSFSVTMYVVIRRELPILSTSQMNIYFEGVKRGIRLDLEAINDLIHQLQQKGRVGDAKVVMAMKQLMEKCWRQNPADRPLMVDVKEKLYSILASKDSVEIKEHALNAAREMNIQKVSRRQNKCVPLCRFLAPDFNYSKNLASDSLVGNRPPRIDSNIRGSTSSVGDAETKLLDFRSNLKSAQRSFISHGVYSNIVGTSKDGDCRGFLAIKRQNVYFYDVTSKKLHHLQTMKLNHYGGTAVILNQRVFVISGEKTNSVETKQANDVGSRWTEVACTTRRRRWASSVVCDGYIYTTGGAWPATSTGERYGYNSDSWNYIKDMLARKWGHTMSNLQGKVYAIGGKNDAIYSSQVECYHPSSNRWTTMPSMIRKRAGLSSAVLNDEIYAIGGQNAFASLASVERYNPEKGSWGEVASLNDPRCWHGSCVINEKIYVAGGSNGLNTIEVYNPVTQQWTVEGIFDELKDATCIVAV